MRKIALAMLLLLTAALCVTAVAAQEITTEPPLPTVEATLETTGEATPMPTSEATAQPTSDAAATASPTVEATAAATEAVAVTAEATTTPGDNNAYLRVAHFAPDGGTLDAFFNDTLTVSGLTFPSVSEWIPVTPGSYTISAAASGQDASSAGGNFAPLTVSAAANTWQTIAIIPAGTGLQAVSFSEDYRDLLPSTNGFTFFNALEGSAPINLMRDGVAYFAQIGFPAQDTTSSSTLRGDSGVFDVAAVDPNDPTHVFAETPDLNLRENTYTLVALIGPADSPRLFVFPTDESAVEIARGLLPKPGTLMDALRANQNLTAFAAALESAGLADMLNGSAEYTIFAPANFAIDGSDSISAEDAANILKSYIVEGKYTKGEFVNAGTLTALDGTTLTITTGEEGIYINGVLVIDVNIAATNGVIHMVRARWDTAAPAQG
jgi:uncharacterized surface protein with fasciclin (FAS1) repeats